MTDIVVLGAGSNSLVTACYLARAGLSVRVLERNAQAGGGVVSVETAPGFVQDTHAMGYMTCLANPVIRNDELELAGRFGLKWIHTEAPFATIYDDGEGLISYTDLDATCAEIARFSAPDADAYRALAADAALLLPVLMRSFYAPPMPDAGFTRLLAASDFGRTIAADMQRSVLAFLDDRFASPRVKMHFAKWAAELMVGPDAPGTGLTLYLLLGMSHRYRMGTVVGGSRNLTAALVRCLTHHGGVLETSRSVRRVVVQTGRCIGVEMDDGEIVRAGRAVVANIHPWRLGEMVEGVPADVVKRAAETRLSEYGAINQQIALTERPRWKAGARYEVATLVECLRNDWEQFTSPFEGFRRGEMRLDHLGPLVNVQSNIDPSRAPPGQAALYLYSFAPLELVGSWPARKREIADAIWEWFAGFTENIDASKIVARLIEAPDDHAAHSRNMMKGDIMGIAMTHGQLLGARPTPDLANYRVPGVEALYLAGPTCHPGGTVTLGGRATAMKMFDDFGLDLARGFDNW